MRKGSTIKKSSIEDRRSTATQDGDRSDLARVDAMSEADVERSIEADPDWRDVPRDWYLGAEAVMPRPKVPVSIRLDADVIEYFRGQGRGWQTKMNAVLRAYADAAKGAG